MGDVINNLPVATDILAHFPDAQIDWVVEAPFSDIPRMHPGIQTIIPVSIRRWRKHLFNRSTWREIREFKQKLQSKRYDIVLDTQGLLKSALITRLARGARCGFAWDSAWEPLATLFYNKKFSVDKTRHAVNRYRLLAAQAFGYLPEPRIDYGIVAPAMNPSWLPIGPFAVLLHATSRNEKLWPESDWAELGAYFNGRGMVCVLPWGNDNEQARSKRLAEHIPGAIVPPIMRLEEAAVMLARASGVVGVDTGLVHLTAALKKPVVAIFCGSDPAVNGLYANSPIRNLGNFGTPPTVAEVINAVEALTSA